MEGYEAQLATVLLAGVIAGLALLVRGMRGYRTAARIGDTGTSRIASLAAGEVRVSGRIEPAEVTLVSPLQSVPCVYYRASVEFGDDDAENPDLSEERAVGFRVHDETGDIRVFPRAARWDAPLYLDESTGAFGEQPAGLSPRRGSAIAPAELDRQAAIAALLSVRPAAGGFGDDAADSWVFGGSWSTVGTGRKRRHYREARLAPGDDVTVIGRAMPFSNLADPAEADLAKGSTVGADDPEVAADLAEARAAGILADDAEAAWGNAAIPGFGIGRPVRSPSLDADAAALRLGSAEEAARVERRFAIAPETLVLAAAPDVPLLIAHGVPGMAAERHQDQFAIGLLGAVLAIGSAMALAILVSGGFRGMSPSSVAALFAVGLAVVVVGFIVVASYNAVIALRQRIDKAWSNIDVALKQRHDQLPALVSAVRGAMAFEQEVLTEVTRARAAYSPTEPIPDQAVHAEVTSAAVRSLFAVVEAYPEVKSQQNVLDLQDEIERLEAMIADRRELYNDQVFRYNTRIATLPTLPLAWVFGWAPREFFAATPDEVVRPNAEL